MSDSIGPLIPPFRYAMVEEGLYRGAYPREPNFRFLERLQLRSLVSLSPKAPSEALLEFCAAHNIAHTHIPLAKFKESDRVPLDDGDAARQALELLVNPARLPLFVHCLDGVHNTGTLIMLLRKLQV